jgi:hypothetical protein
VRKFILIAAFALASVSVQAAERIDRVPADNDAPAAAALPVAALPIATPPVTAPPAAAPATAEIATPQTSRKQASRSQVSRSQVSRKQAYGSRMIPREIDEQKARRIAAAYGISW